jgi:purine-nucleoside phosphorylase
MGQQFSLEEIGMAAQAILDRTSHRPGIGIILGSGLNGIAAAVEEAIKIPFSDLPHFPTATVDGHSGKVVVGKLEGRAVVVLQGRIHFYEGYSMAQVTLPVRVMKRLGVDRLIVTNAAGGIHPDYCPGDIMLILDHINLIGMSGHDPLMGPNDLELGPRFPDMSQAYDRELCDRARRVAREIGLPLREGNYAGVGGPSFETPADLRFLRTAGADAVGMSTVPEVIVARHGSMRVLGLSGISNRASLDGSTPTKNEDVIEAGKVIAPKLEKLIRGIVKEL